MTMPKGPLTNILVAANVLIWLVITLAGIQNMVVIEGAFIPGRFTLDLPVGPGYPQYVPAAATFLSHAFLHVGFFHLLMNMLILLFAGRFVEMALGWKLMLPMYLAGAIAGAAAELAWNPTSLGPVIGASGAISAIMAAYMLLFARTPPKPWGPIPAHWARMLQLMILWVVINLMLRFGLEGSGLNIAIVAHIGGFAVGLLLARPMLGWRYRDA